MATDSVCSKCGGVGWIIVERSSVSGAQRCECRKDGLVGRLEERAEIPPLYSHATLDNFNIRFPDNPIAAGQLSFAHVTVQNYVRDYPHGPRPGLLLIGEQGCGKTHLAVGVLRKVMEKGFACLFCDYQGLLDRIRAGYDPASRWADKEAYRVALDVEVLLLDDLGAHRGNEWVEDIVTAIITHRCNQKRTLIATTNLPDGDAGSSVTERSALGTPTYRRTLADAIGARARSRLFEMCTVIKMPAVEDYRIRKAKLFT